MIVEGLLDFYVRLDEAKIRCLVVGSVATIAFGEPRSTVDIDLIAMLDERAISRLESAFADPRFYVPPTEVLRREARRRNGCFNIIDSETGLKADIYAHDGDELVSFGFDHAITCELLGRSISLAPPTYLAAMKLRYFALGKQDKHLRDIRGMPGT